MRALVAICLIAGLGFTADAVAQGSQSTPDTSVPTLKANARLTVVDVTATDAKQHPVHGLAKPDFTLKEDDKQQAIKNFEEFGADRPAEQAPPLPPDVYSNRPASQPGTQAVNILMLDNASTGFMNHLRMSPDYFMVARQQSVKYLQNLPAGTEVAVLDLADGLKVMQGFTSDKTALLAAARSVPTAMVPMTYLPSTGFPPLGAACLAANTQSRLALQALNQVVPLVAGIQGKKNLIWFTPGIPWLTDYSGFVSDHPGAYGCVNDYTHELQETYIRLTSAQVVLYSIDPRGLFSNPDGGAAADGAPRNPLQFLLATREDQGSLADMAKATGGVAYFNRNDMAAAVGEAITTGSDYYSLSYTPPLSKYDGKYHTINVKVDRPGVNLEYRRGYTSLDLNGPRLETTKGHGESVPAKSPFQSGMSYGAPTATQVVFAVRALPAVAQPGSAVIGQLNAELNAKPLVRYSFAFDVPRNKITLEEQPDGSRKATFELAIAAYDAQGRVLNSLDERRSFALKADAVADFLAKPFVVPVAIDLPTGTLSVRAGVLDLPSEEMGVVEIPLTVTR